MSAALLKRVFTKRGLLALLIAYLSFGELYMGGLQLWESLSFFLNSTAKQAQVVDVRRREAEDFYQLLPSGEVVFQGGSLYYPIVTYTSPNFMVPLRLELPAPSSNDYQRGAMLDIRTQDDNNLLAQESHGFFMWGGSLIRLSMGLLLASLAYALFKRAKVTSAPAPKVVEAPVKPVRKKSAAPKKEAALKKKATRKKTTKSKA